MKFSELKGRAVVILEDAKKIGEVEDLLVEPDSHRIVSLKVKTGLFQATKIVAVGDIKNVGADAVTISEGSALASNPADAGSPTVSATGSGAAVGAQPIDLTSILGNKVVTDAGTLVGELRDVLVDWTDLTITGYEVHEGGLFGKAQEFSDSPDVRYGDKLITIPAQLMSHPK